MTLPVVWEPIEDLYRFSSSSNGEGITMNLRGFLHNVKVSNEDGWNFTIYFNGGD